MGIKRSFSSSEERRILRRVVFVTDFNNKVENYFEESWQIRIAGKVSNRKSRRQVDILLIAIGDYVKLKRCLK